MDFRCIFVVTDFGSFACSGLRVISEIVCGRCEIKLMVKGWRCSNDFINKQIAFLTVILLIKIFSLNLQTTEPLTKLVALSLKISKIG